MAFIDFWKKIEPKKENKFAHATYDALFTLGKLSLLLSKIRPEWCCSTKSNTLAYDTKG